MKYFLEGSKRRVHWEGCSKYTERFSATYVGKFDNDLSALEVARLINPKVCACNSCMTEVSEPERALESL